MTDRRTRIECFAVADLSVNAEIDLCGSRKCDKHSLQICMSDLFGGPPMVFRVGPQSVSSHLRGPRNTLNTQNSLRTPRTHSPGDKMTSAVMVLRKACMACLMCAMFVKHVVSLTSNVAVRCIR